MKYFDIHPRCARSRLPVSLVAFALLLLSMFSSQTLCMDETQFAEKKVRAINTGLDWLRKTIQENGAVQSTKHQGALTSLLILSHLAAGVSYHDPQHGPTLQRSLSFILSQQTKDGYFGAKDKSRMYGHGITVLMLGESLGMIGDPELEHQVRTALSKAVSVINTAASVKKSTLHQGGWHYEPAASGADMSVSGWQIIALHSSRQAGIEINHDIHRAGIHYARRMCNAETGSVAYNNPKLPRPSLRGLGLLCLSIEASPNDEQRINRIAHNIHKDPIPWKGPWFFYRSYYDAVGLSMADTELWQEYRKHLYKLLIAQQHKEGWWKTPPADNEGRFGKNYCTSLALLALCVDRHLLPAFQN